MRFAIAPIMLLAAVLVVSVSAPEAEACSCSGNLRTFPDDGAIDVPLNVKPSLFQRYEFLRGTSFGLRIVGHQDVVPSLATRHTRERHGDTLVVLEPTIPLIPQTDYEILQGQFVISTFRTGEEHDLEALRLAPLQSFSVETMDTEARGSSCVEGYEDIFGRLRIKYGERPQDAAYFLLNMHSESGEFWNDDWILLSSTRELEPLSIADLTCNPRPPILRPGQRYCASLAAVDLAGNVSDSQELCATANACRFALVGDYAPTQVCDAITEDEADIEEPDSGGCSMGNHSAPNAAWLLLGLWALGRRRRNGDLHSPHPARRRRHHRKPMLR